MIAYRYCSSEEVEELKNDNIKGYKYKTNKLVNTHEYNKKEKYLHFYLDPDSIFSYDNIEPSDLLEFRFPNEYEVYRGIGCYYFVDEDGNVQTRRANQLAIPAKLVRREHVKNIQPLKKEEYNDNIKKLVRHGI